MASVRRLVDRANSLPNQHPLHVGTRTYALALSLSLIPALLSLIASGNNANSKRKLHTLLKNSFGPSGLPLAMLITFGGASYLEWIWTQWPKARVQEGDSESKNKPLSLLTDASPRVKTFVSAMFASFVSFHALQRRRAKGAPAKASATLDLTLLLAVRALDVGIQSVILQRSLADDRLRRARSLLDALVFWASSSRIMWCWFYEADRLPRSYSKWIASLAELDPTLMSVLRAVQDGTWRYGQPLPPQITHLASLASEAGFPAAWGDPQQLPNLGGKLADAAWARLGVTGRDGVGGLPCDIVHGGICGNSCTAHALTRGLRTFQKALLIYIPVHILPALLTNPTRIVLDPLPFLRAIFRSSSFLASFVASIWLPICMCRTVLVPRLFPSLPHQFIDGPYGGVLIETTTHCHMSTGTLVCGSSIWIEMAKRRGEMALYVAPRAMRTCLPEGWIRTNRAWAIHAERLVFTLSLATLWTAARHDTQHLRGISRWTLAFIKNGWKQGSARHDSVAADSDAKRPSSPGSTYHSEPPSELPSEDELSGSSARRDIPLP